MARPAPWRPQRCTAAPPPRTRAPARPRRSSSFSVQPPDCPCSPLHCQRPVVPAPAQLAAAVVGSIALDQGPAPQFDSVRASGEFAPMPDMMLHADALRAPNLRHAFFTRHGGVSGGIYASLNGGLGSQDAPGNGGATPRG